MQAQTRKQKLTRLAVLDRGRFAAALLALVALATAARARADFYDGCRGPNQLQLDQRLMFGEGAPSYVLLPKLFLDPDRDGIGLFQVLPFNYVPDSSVAIGHGGGAFFDLGQVSFLGVVPVVYAADAEAVNVGPTLYATIMAGDVLIDPRVSYVGTIAGGTISHSMEVAATIGYQIDSVILGFDIGASFDPANAGAAPLDEVLAYQGIARIDLDEKHRNWLQAYVAKDAVGMGFRANFDWL